MNKIKISQSMMGLQRLDYSGSGQGQIAGSCECWFKNMWGISRLAEKLLVS
jgi:hypothetical protein